MLPWIRATRIQVLPMSAITFWMVSREFFRYRGYPIEQLAEKSNFLEVSLSVAVRRTAQCVAVNRLYQAHHQTYPGARRCQKFFDGWPSSAHPMGQLCSLICSFLLLSGITESEQEPGRSGSEHHPHPWAKMPTLVPGYIRSPSDIRSSIRTITWIM